jgi:hypothetical protein
LAPFEQSTVLTLDERAVELKSAQLAELDD